MYTSPSVGSASQLRFTQNMRNAAASSDVPFNSAFQYLMLFAIPRTSSQQNLILRFSSRNSQYSLYFCIYVLKWPITVAALFKARTVFAPSDTGILGWNSTQRMGVCVRLFYVCAVLCVGSSLATG
jgi:hypothetical protein